jgi:undecaprenyl-diphosphatase
MRNLKQGMFMTRCVSRPRLRLSSLVRVAKDEIGLVASVLVVGALVLCFGLIAEEVFEGDTSRLDESIILLFRSAANPAEPIGPAWLQEMARDVTSLGSFAFLGFLTLASCGYLLLVKKPALAMLMAVSVVGGQILNTGLKAFFERPRPDIDTTVRVFTNSFPSGHAMMSAVTFLTLAALLARANPDRRIKIYFLAIAVFLTIVTGVSRVFLGVHYPTDVLAGWCTGSAWAMLCWTVALWLQRRGEVEPEGAESPDAEPRLK